MRGIERNGHGELTLLELLLHLEGDIRRRLEPIRVTPPQAWVLLFQCRHTEARGTDAAVALGVRLQTMSTVVTALVRKRWVSKRHPTKDDRVVSLLLSPQGQTLARKIKTGVRQVSTGVTANNALTATGLARLHRISAQHKDT